MNRVAAPDAKKPPAGMAGGWLRLDGCLQTTARVARWDRPQAAARVAAASCMVSAISV
jgi:hypothetical protein